MGLKTALLKLVAKKVDTKTSTGTIYKTASESSGGTGFVSTSNPSVPSTYSGPATSTPKIAGGSSGFVSGGSGGSSGGSSSSSSQPTQTSTETIPTTSSTNQQISQDTGPISTVTAGVSNTGITNAVNYFRENIKYDDPHSTIKGTAQIATGGIRDRINDLKLNRQKQQEEKFQKEVQQREGQFVSSQAERDKAYTGYSGTSQDFQYQQTPTEVLERNIASGDQASQSALANRYNKENENYARYLITQKNSENQGKIGNYTAQLQLAVNEGKLSLEQANAKQRNYANNLNNLAVEETKVEVDKRVNYQQSRLNKLSDYGMITRIGVAVGSTFIAGVGASAILRNAPKIIKVGADVAGGVGFAATGRYVVKNAETLTALEVAGVILPTISFMAGARVGGKMATSKTNVKLTEALNRAEVYQNIKGSVSNEAQINALKIPEATKAELRARFNAGERITLSEYKIKGVNDYDQALINKNLPTQKAEFIEVTNQFGNVVNRVAIGKTEFGGKKIYRENVLQVGTGETIPGTKTTIIENVNLRVPEKGRGPTEISKTVDVANSKSNYYFDEGNLMRSVYGESQTFLGEKIIGSMKKPISFKDFEAVVRSEKINRFPSSQTKGSQIEQVTNIQEINAAIKANENLLGFNVKEVQLKNIQGGSKTSKLPEPIVFEKGISSRKIKGFETPEDIGIKIPGTKGSQETVQIVKKVNVPTSNVADLVKGSAKSSLPTIIEENLFPTFANANVQKVKTDSKVVNNFVQPGLDINVNAIRNLAKEKEKTDVFVGNRGSFSPRNNLNLKNVQTPVVIPAQKIIQKIKPVEVLKTKQVNIPEFNPLFNTPRVPVPKIDIPYPNVFRNNKDSEKLFKQLTKQPKKTRTPYYTASLAAAAFQAKPFQVTKKQYQQLSKRTYTGAETRPVLEIIPDGEVVRKAKKKLSQVDFFSLDLNSGSGGAKNSVKF